MNVRRERERGLFDNFTDKFEDKSTYLPDLPTMFVGKI